MKKLLLTLILAAGSYGYKMYIENPSVITDPIYLESRLKVQIPNSSRQLEYVFVGEMSSASDCEYRERRHVERVFEECDICQVTTTQCKPIVADRYKKLFSGHNSRTTHLSFDRGNRFERNGKMVVWGLSEAEARQVCQEVKVRVIENYEGTVRCVDKTSI